MTAIPVDVLTGFLGAGKTSLLNRLLATPEFSDAAVLINEFGEIGLDHLLVERVEGEIVLLKSGCVCCTIRGDLKEALLCLLGRRARGEIPAFGRVVIETTGLADPAPIAATLALDPALRHHVAPGAVVTVVDAVNGAATLDAHDVAVRQIAAADRIVLSKIDLAAPAVTEALTRRLARLNPAAEVVPLDAEAPAPQALLRMNPHDDAARGREVSRWLAAKVEPEDGRHGPVRAFALTADRPLDWARFGLWLSMLLNRHGGSILRLKGLLEAEGVATPVVIQGVQHLVHAPSHLAAWPEGRRGTRLVVIARDLDPAEVERSFRAFCAPGERAAPPVSAANA